MIGRYKDINRNILKLVLAEISVQIINAGFLFILLIHFQKSGYSDHEGAGFIKYRFLSVLLMSVPLGILIRGRRILPFFLFGCITVPTASLLILYGIEIHHSFLINVSQFLWGMGFACIQITALPYILRNSSEGKVTEGISLSHATWSLGGIFAGLSIYFLRAGNKAFFLEGIILLVFSLLSFAGIFFILSMNKQEKIEEERTDEKKKGYDWDLIIKAMIPSIIIATGAGLTIPFISVFFYNVHHLDSEFFSIAATVALVLVFLATLAVPLVKNRMGYKTAVPLTQSLAIAMLVGLAITEPFAGTTIALVMALVFYTLRQPLMNIAGPMTTEVTMMYVGKRNQEMMSALNASIWSGSWFISSLAFEVLRGSGIAYMYIFLMTAAFYSVGVFAYFLLIRDYERRDKKQHN